MGRLLVISFTFLMLSGCATTYVANIGVRKENIEKMEEASYQIATYKTTFTDVGSFNTLVSSYPVDVGNADLQPKLNACKLGDKLTISVNGKYEAYVIEPNRGNCVATRKYRKPYWYPAQVLKPIAMAADHVIFPFMAFYFMFTL